MSRYLNNKYAKVAAGLILLVVLSSFTVWRLSRKWEGGPAPGGPDTGEASAAVADYSPVGPGYTAVVETSRYVPGPRGAEVFGRVLFFSHRHLDLRGVVPTTGDTFVSGAWASNHFLVAWNLPPDGPPGSYTSRAKVVEFKPDANRVTGEYVHPRGLARLMISGSPYQQRSATACGGDGTLWMLTEEVVGGKVRQQLEAVHWNDKTVKHQVPIPTDSINHITPLPLDAGCAMISSAGSRGEARVVLPDGQQVDVPLGLEKGEQLGFLVAGGNLIGGYTTNGRLVAVEWHPQRRQGTVRFRQKIFSSGATVQRVALLPEETAVILGLGPDGGTAIDRVTIVSALDGVVLREGRLEKPALNISYGDKHIWALNRDTFSFTAYDANLKVARRQPHPLIEVVDLRP